MILLTRTTTFTPFALRRVDISDFPLSQYAKLQQCLSTEEDEQQPLSVHLWGKKHWNSLDIMNHGMCKWWQLLQTVKRALMQWWWAIVKVMMLLSPFNQWEFSIPGETGNSLFSKDVHSISIFFGLHPLTSKSSIFYLCPVLLQLFLTSHNWIK